MNDNEQYYAIQDTFKIINSFFVMIISTKIDKVKGGF